MTWISGNSDVGHIQQDLHDLLTGTAATNVVGSIGRRSASGQQSNGGQVTGGDVWVDVDAANWVIRSQYTEKSRHGQITMYRGIPRFVIRSASMVNAVDVAKPTFSGTYNGAVAKVFYQCYVSTANSVAGNLTGTVVTYTVSNSVTNATVQTGTITGWSGSTSTKAIGYGNISLTLTIAGGVTLDAGSLAPYWYRGYSSTYTDGIDYHPDIAFAKSGTFVVSNSSGGANNYTLTTDYLLVYSQDTYPFDQGIQSGTDGLGAFSGIHWVSGGTNPASGTLYYLVNFDTYPAIFQILFAAQYAAFPVYDAWDAIAHVGRNNNNAATNSSHADALLWSASQGSSVFINFWLSVKSDKVTIVLEGDPAYTGGTTPYVWSFQRYTSLFPSTDKLPWCVTSYQASTFSNSQCRIPGAWVYSFPYYGSPTVGVSSGTATYAAGYYGSYTSLTCSASIGPANNPYVWDGKWWLWTLQLNQYLYGQNSSGTNLTTVPAGVVGTLRGIYRIGSTNWTNLDELVNNATADVYLLITGGNGWSSYSAILEE